MGLPITYDALLVLSFGGPEKPDDVIPFLENVTAGRNVPRERLLQVAEHYYHFGGKSPINDQNRALIAALQPLVPVPIYWGNRNWTPLLTDTLRQMRADGIRYAAAFVTSAYGSYSGCRQYLDDIAQAQCAVGHGAPAICKLPAFWNNPGFIGPLVEHVTRAIAGFDHQPPVAFTAHSVPSAMADTSPYVQQLTETCGLVAGGAGIAEWSLVYQSRSGPPSQPWLEPDILDHIHRLHAQGHRELLIVPVGFISDHMEVLYDLDTEAKELCDNLGIHMVRAPTVGTHPRFVQMIRDQLYQPCRVCSADCCPNPRKLAFSGPPR